MADSIHVKLPDGSVKEVPKGTTALDIAKSIGSRLAEVTLSFFGLGVGEPVPSWGNMLAAAQQYEVLASYWWMFLPAIALSTVSLLYYVLANALHQQMMVLSS